MSSLICHNHCLLLSIPCAYTAAFVTCVCFQVVAFKHVSQFPLFFGRWEWCQMLSNIYTDGRRSPQDLRNYLGANFSESVWFRLLGECEIDIFPWNSRSPSSVPVPCIVFFTSGHLRIFIENVFIIANTHATSQPIFHWPDTKWNSASILMWSRVSFQEATTRTCACLSLSGVQSPDLSDPCINHSATSFIIYHTFHLSRMSVPSLNRNCAVCSAGNAGYSILLLVEHCVRAMVLLQSIESAPRVSVTSDSCFPVETCHKFQGWNECNLVISPG